VTGYILAAPKPQDNRFLDEGKRRVWQADSGHGNAHDCAPLALDLEDIEPWLEPQAVTETVAVDRDEYRLKKKKVSSQPPSGVPFSLAQSFLTVSMLEYPLLDDRRRPYLYDGVFCQRLKRQMARRETSFLPQVTLQLLKLRVLDEIANPSRGITPASRWECKDSGELGYDTKTNEAVVRIDERYFRPAEVELLHVNSSNAEKQLGWKCKVDFPSLVEEMVSADIVSIETQNVVRISGNGY